MSHEPNDIHGDPRDEDDAPHTDDAVHADGAPGGSAHEPDDIHGVPDATLGGYLDTHDRPPAFEGTDGHPYTVSVEVEQTPDLRAPYVGYLVFPRWASTGLGIVGHVQTPMLCRERGRAAAEGYLRELPLDRLKTLLDEGIAQGSGAVSGEPRPDPYSFGSEW
jgi:hypothetical protein